MAAIKVGHVEGGYRFKGGDPGQQESWEEATSLKAGDIDGGYRFKGGDPGDKKNWEDANKTGTFDAIKQGLGTVKDYGLAIASGAGEGVSSTVSGAGTFIQAPAANTLSGVMGARALADRGITAALNYVAPGSAETNPEYQEAAQQASAFAAERRAENVVGNPIARLGVSMQEGGRERVKMLQDFNKENNPELVRQQQAMGATEGFVGALEGIKDNPMAFTHMLARSAPDMAAGAGVAKGAAKVIAARGGSSASQIAGASTAGIMAESASSANQAREMVYQQIADMPPARLAASPRYREILQAVGDPIKAREALANELADQAPILAGTGTALGSVITNKMFGGDTSAKMIAGAERTTGKEVAKNIAQESVEEGLQGVPEDLVQHGAIVQADPSKKFDMGKTLAENMAAGAAMGGAGSSMAYARDNWRRGNDGAVPGAAPDNATPADQVLGGGANSEQAAAASTEAEKALYSPANLTALDRVAEIDAALPNAAPEDAAALQVERESITKTWPNVVAGAPSSFSTETGARLEGQYALVEAGDLITSHDENLRPSPLYPQELQPRERDRAASEMQVSGIVQKLDPARLGLSADAATGAPIVGADGLVESGNARTIALKRVYQANGAKADNYKQFLKDNAAQFGIVPESVDQMRRPVLVRVRSTPVNRAEFARQANASTVAQMSPSEQAKSDANRLDVLDDLRPDENGDFTASRDFIRRFMAKLPATEQSGMIDAAGNLSQTGYTRIRNAVLAKAYGDSPVLTRMVESMDDSLRNVGKALMQAAPEIAKLRQDVTEGALFDADITPDLMAAVTELSALRDSGRSIQDALAQAGMFGEKYSPETRELLQFLNDNIRRPRVMAEFILRYTEALRAAGNPNQGSIFGEAEAPTKGQLLTIAKGNENADEDPQRANAGKDESAGGQGASQPADAQRGEGRTPGDEGAKSEWVRFPAETGTLGIPRAEMPQIKGDHRGALIQFLNARGVTHKTVEEMPAGDLKPTQAEFSTKKTETWKDAREGVDRSVLISSDGYILDGHHQWVAALATGGPVKAIQFSTPIRELLAAVYQFPSVRRSDGHTSDDPKRAKAREDFTEALADLGIILRDFAQVARMVPEKTPDFMPALIKAFEAGIKLVGFNIKDLIAHVKKAAKASPELKTIWNKINDETYRKAAKMAVDNMLKNPAESFGQGDLFGASAKQEPAKGQTQDLFSMMAAAAPEVFPPTRLSWDERKKGNYVAPDIKDVVPADVHQRTAALVEKWKNNLPEAQISKDDREKAEALLRSVIDAAERDESWFDERVRAIGKMFLGSQLGPTKKIGRAAVKLVEEKFNLAEMKDIVRATVVVNSYDDAQETLDAIGQKFEILQINNKTDLQISAPDGSKLKNKGVSPEGYSDVTAFVRLPGGGIAEIQINTPEMLSAKADAHILYEGSRVVEDDSERQDEYAELRDGQRDIYQAAAASALRRLASSTERMKYASSEPQPLETGERGSGTSATLSSSKRNQFPSGNLTNSSPPNEDIKPQPSGNFSGTGIISSTSNDSIAENGSGSYTEAKENASGVANEQHGKRGQAGDEGQGADAVRGSGKGRKADGVREGSGRGNRGSDRVDDAKPADQREVGQPGADGVRGQDQAGGRNEPRNRAGRNAGVPAGRDIPVKTGRNYSFGDEDLTYAGSWHVKARQNVEAVELLKKLEAEGRQATPDEQKTLAKFIGWGASEIANSIFGDKLDKQIDLLDRYDRAMAAFDRYGKGTLGMRDQNYYDAFLVAQSKSEKLDYYSNTGITKEQVQSAKPDPAVRKWAELRDRLKAVMSEQEWKEASRSTQYAHYTSKQVVGAMWQAMERMGFKGGSILEPGAGIGVFPGLMPKGMATNSIYTGIEFDSITGGILKQLFPDERILVESFVDSKLPKNFYDVAAGNPPFNSTAILSDPEYKKQALALHDYFFAKTIDRVKPGGLVMFVTSRYTMDKLNDKARAYLADRADLAGAIRLPQTAFKKNAGTEVVTDVLFLRKKVDGETFEHGRPWAKSVPIKVNGKEYNINEYFAAHPEMVLGEHSDAGSMYGDREYTVLPKAGDIEAQFAEAANTLPADIYKADRGSSAEAAQVRELDFNPKVQKEGNYYVTDAGVLMQREGGVGVRVQEKLGKGAELVKDFVGVRDALKQAHYDQLNDGDWGASLKALQKAYAAFVKKHGRINQFTEYKRTEKLTDEETGETYEDERSYKRFPLLAKIQDDPDYSLAMALETINDETGEISDSAFLSKRVLDKPKRAEVRMPTDALLTVLNDLGHVDIDAIADRLDFGRQETIDALGSTVYEDPAAGWVMADEYLSGNVKKKLAAAEEAAKSDKRFERNIEALMAVQPTPVPPADITVSLGMNWIPAETYQQFLYEKAGVEARVIYNERTGQWAVDVVRGGASTAATQDWGTPSRPAGDILLAALTGAPIRITETVKEPGGGTKSEFRPEATEAANQKLAQMRDAFREWMWQDAERTDKLVKLYNDTFNTIVPRSFDGQHLTLPGASAHWQNTAFPHVKRGVWRIVQSGNTYLGHAVGSGKTAQMVMSAMEQKRLGLISKPMIVVPNHMLQQFAREWQEIYPAARLMVADEKNFHTENRRRWVSRVAMSDLDGVVITHSAFKLLDLDPEFKQQMIEQELDYLRAALQEAGGSEETAGSGKKKKSRDPKIKQIESKIEKMEQKLEAAMSSAGKDKNVRFDEMGVDFLYVDEAHEFRKLSFTTQRQVKGIDSSGSDRAFDLWMKTRWLEQKKPGRSLAMASGTPVTNTLAELYSVQRFMAPEVLEERGLEEFDAWASMFGQENTEIEADASGKYAPVTRFSKFVNVPELTQMFREFADVLTSDHLAALVGDKRPKVKDGSRKLVITPQTDAYTEFKRELASRLEISRKWKPSQDEPNNPDPVIRIIGDGRLAAIDMRFVDPSLPSDPDSKLNKMADEVIRVYQETSNNEYKDKATGEIEPNKGATQVVFSDLGFGAGVAENRGFNARAWFEKRLRDAGIPASHVAFMSDHKKSTAKLKLFKDVNAGRVRILVGSSKNMGTGVNAQQRLIALHHLDTPWYPADLEQREGRIVRQGNKNPLVELYAYSTKGSYDAVMWQMLASKQRFIDQALSGDSSVRSIDDLSEASQFQQATAMTADDPRAIQLAGLRAEVEKLQRLYRAHEEQRAKMRQEYDWAGRTIELNQKMLPDVQKIAGKVQDLSGDRFAGKVGGTTYTDRKEWGAAVLAKYKDLADSLRMGSEKIAEMSGFSVVFNGRKTPAGSYDTHIAVDMPESVRAFSAQGSILAETPTADAVGVAMRTANAVMNVARLPAQIQQRITEAADKRSALEPRLNAPFQFSEMLADKIKESQDLEADMLAAQNTPTGLEREQQLEDEWQKKTGAITPLFSRGSGSGMAVRDLKAVVSRVSPGFKNLPPVHVLESPAQAPKALREYIEEAGATDTAEGAMHEGEIYLFASGLSGEARAEHVLATHEITHYGLRGAVGKGLDSALQYVWMHNSKVRREAHARREKFGIGSNVEAVEEVLADMKTEDLAKLSGWRRVAKAVRDWLRKAGAEKLADRLDAWMTAGLDDQQRADLFVADLVTAARDWVKNGKKPAAGVFGMAATRLADGTLAEDVAEQERWLTKEAKARGYKDIEDLLARNYPLFEKLATLWREKNPVEMALLSRKAGSVEPSVRSTGFDKASGTVVSDFKNDQPLKAHADYKAAKSGDIDAAARLVQALVKPESIEMAKAFGKDAIYVPVHAEEAAGRNQIPNMLALHYAGQVGAAVDDTITQENRAYHTGANAMERLLARSEFSGTVEPGRRYVLVDDVTTMGSTLADLASYIRSQGGEVVGSAVLVNAMRGGMLTPASKTINELEARHGEEIRKLFGVDPVALTWSESQYLLGFRTTDELRKRVAKAGQERLSRLRAKGVLPEREDPQGSVSRLSRADAAQAQGTQQQTAAERADAILSRSAATWKPIDTIARKLTQTFRVDALTRAAYTRAGALLDRWTPENVKAGVVADYGIPEAVIDRRVAMTGAMKQQIRKSGELIEKLATLTREESRVAYEWMNNADPQAAAYFEAQLSPESVKVMAEVKRLIDELSQEAMRMGQLSPEAFERNRFEYLHRSYIKHTTELTKGETESRRRAIAVLGDQYKGRGMTDAIDMAKFKNVAPEWWGRKLQAGKADVGLKGEKFVRLERRAPVGEGTRPLQESAGPGEANPLRKGKLLEVAYWPSGEQIPAKFSTWELAGTWEVRDTKGGKLVVWRDFTKAERVAMGEIDEARYAIAKTLHGMIHDIETGRYLEYLAQRHAKKQGEAIDGEVVEASESMRATFAPGTWVKVPDTKVQGTNVLKYGTLAGRYLPGPIWNDVRQTVGFRFKPFGETYAAILSAWKTAKTALSPAVHTNNVMANMVMADWHDITAGHMVKALRILLAAHERDGAGVLGRTGNAAARAGIADREAAKEIINRFQESGGNLGTWAATELQKEQLEPLLQALENEIGIAGQTPGAQVGTWVALQKLLQLKLPSAWDAFKPTKAGKALTTEAGNLIGLYEAEDQVFRLAAWLKAKEEGAGDLAAGKVARRSFLDYHINAPWIQAARSTVFPFAAFTYRAVPMMLNIAANKPWKLMKLAAFAGALNALGYLLSGGDEDDERRLLPEEKAGRIWGLVPKLLRMPWNDDNSEPVFLDIRRFVPMGDIFDTGATNTALPVVPALVPGGPLAVLAELVINKAQFTGKAITLETDTAGEKTFKVAEHMFKAFAPNLIVLPGTYAWTGMVNASTGRTDSFGREQSTPQAVASAFGVKLGSYPRDQLQLNAQRKAQGEMMEIDRNITQLKRELVRKGITQAEFQEKAAVQMEKKKKVQQDLAKRMAGN